MSRLSIRNPQSAIRNWTRRDLLKVSTAGMIGASVSGWFDVLAAQAAAQGVKHKSCILLFMDGGPSQVHTWDPKPGGDYKAIPTSVPGIQIAEHLPKVAQQMQHITLLRGMSTSDGNHGSAHYLVRTGFRKGAGGLVFPHLGSVVSSELGDPHSELPNFVVLKSGSGYHNGMAAGHLGPLFGPLLLRDVSRGIQDINPVVEMATVDRRADLLNELDKGFHSQYQTLAAEAHRAGYQAAVRMMHSDKAVKAFKIDQEKPATRKLYGETKFGDEVMAARRLVEFGVPFVEVVLPGWDTHGGAAEKQKLRCQDLDTPMAGLLTDLKDRGMLDSTLVISMGEFGRDFRGSNHYPKAWTAVMAGGGLKTGQVIGRTDAKGMTVEDRPISIADFLGTVFHALDINYNKKFKVGTRPVGMVDKGGKHLQELFS